MKGRWRDESHSIFDNIYVYATGNNDGTFNLMTTQSQFINANKLAQVLGVCRSTAIKARAKVGFPQPVQITPNGRKLWRVAEVEKFVKGIRPI